jgi:hypothetical protein
MFNWFKKVLPPATDKEKVERALENKRFPDCGSKHFSFGPEGGMNVNIMCANEKCCSAFNVAYFNGSLMYAERIPNRAWDAPIKKDGDGKVIA